MPAIKDQTSAHPVLQRTPVPPVGNGGMVAARFGALDVRQRELVDGFVAEARPWALRQARRAYAHLPAELHEQAVDQAVLELRTTSASRLDRRALSARFAEALNASLARAHAGWCLNQARASWGTGTAEPAPSPADPAHPIAGFVENGLAGLERAVLQMEIGAGRDTATTRAALRLGPAQYKRHRERGLSKLRSAIAAQVAGRVCDQHADAVMLAATGNDTAAADLSAGPNRCRACAREATALRRLLHGRLAVAPWPLAVKPAGVIAAKLAGLGAFFGGKGGGTASVASLASAKGLAAVVVSAVAATGAVAAQRVPGPEAPAVERVAAAETRPAVQPARAKRADRAADRAERRRASRRPEADRRPTARRPASRPAPVAAGAPAGVAPAPAPAAQPAPADVLPDVTADVKPTVGKVVGEVRAKVPPVAAPQTGVAPVDDAVGQVTDATGRLLTP